MSAVVSTGNILDAALGSSSAPLEGAGSIQILPSKPKRKLGILPQIITQSADPPGNPIIASQDIHDSPIESNVLWVHALATPPSSPVPTIRTATPACSTRYDVSSTLPTNRPPVKIGALQRSSTSELPSDPDYPLTWSEYDHPEGNVYYAADIVERYGLRVVTEASAELLSKIGSKFLPHILYLLRKELGNSADGSNINNWDIAIFPEGEDSFAYYMIDHMKGVIFWLEEFPGQRIGIGHEDDIVPVNPKLCLNVQYWRHVEIFPSHLPECVMANADRLLTLKSMVIAAITDHRTCGSASLAPLSPEPLIEMRDHLDGLKDSTTLHSGLSYRNWVVARGYKTFGEAQITHGHGTQFARIDRSMKFRFNNKPNIYHFARALCLIILLNGQAGIHRRLRHTWGDGVISQHEWCMLVQYLLDTWQQQTLLATIVLAAAIGLLAIPYPGDENHPKNIGCHSIYIFCAISCAFVCIFALVSGLMLQRLFRAKIHFFADTAATWLQERFWKKLRLLPLAVLLSSPWLFLQTGLGFLIVALGAMAIGVHGLHTWAVYVYTALASVCVATLILTKYVAGDHAEEGSQGNPIVMLYYGMNLNLMERARALGGRIQASAQKLVDLLKRFVPSRFARSQAEEHSMEAPISQAV